MKASRHILAFFAACSLAAIAFAASPYRVIMKVKLPGNGGWDYLSADAQARRLYVSHATQVDVVDLDTVKPVGTIPDTPGVHGVAPVPALGRGFISNGKASTVTIFDLKTLKKMGDVKAGENPDAIIFDPATNRVFAFNGHGKSATVIDAEKGVAIATIPLAGKPEFAASDGKGHVFVNLEDKNSVTKIDSRELKVEETWPLPGCEEPGSMAMDVANDRIFIGCGSKVMAAVNAQNGKVIKTLPIGDHVDASVFDAEKGLIFNACGDGTLTEIHEDTPDEFTLVENVPTRKGARTVALDSQTHRLYLVTADFGPTPAPTAEHPHQRPSIVPGTFVLVVVGQ